MSSLELIDSFGIIRRNFLSDTLFLRCNDHGLRHLVLEHEHGAVHDAEQRVQSTEGGDGKEVERLD